MTQDEFYSKLMQDVEYIFKTGFKLSPEMFMQTISYASEQYELLRKRIAELEYGNSTLRLSIDASRDHIAELEAPESCEGCKYEIFYGLDNCTNCSSAKFLIDRYEPKDSE
jgi:hypothetical protein